MFATNVIGPFLFTNLLLERLEQSNALLLDVIAPFDKALDWDDLESLEAKPLLNGTYRASLSSSPPARIAPGALRNRARQPAKCAPVALISALPSAS